MILEGSFTFLQVAQVVATSLIGLFGVACALNGNLFTKINPVFRLLFAAGGLLMMVPDTLTDVVGIAIIAALVGIQYVLRKRGTSTPQTPAVAA